MGGRDIRIFRITAKADEIRAAISHQGKICTNPRFVVLGQLRQHAQAGFISRDDAIAALSVFEDETLGSGTPTSNIKALLDEGVLEELAP
jgi:hypothetical protein